MLSWATKIPPIMFITNRLMQRFKCVRFRSIKFIGVSDLDHTNRGSAAETIILALGNVECRNARSCRMSRSSSWLLTSSMSLEPRCTMTARGGGLCNAVYCILFSNCSNACRKPRSTEYVPHSLHPCCHSFPGGSHFDEGA